MAASLTTGTQFRLLSATANEKFRSREGERGLMLQQGEGEGERSKMLPKRRFYFEGGPASLPQSDALFHFDAAKDLKSTSSTEGVSKLWRRPLLLFSNISRDRASSLFRVQSFVLYLNYFQVFALILAMVSQGSLFPDEWVQNAHFVHAANIDAWLLSFRNTSSYSVLLPPDNATFAFQLYMWVFVGLVVFISFSYCLLKALISRFANVESALFWKSFLFLSGFFFATVLYYPVGMVVFRTLQCTSRLDNANSSLSSSFVSSNDSVFQTIDVLVVDHETTCWTMDHLLFYLTTSIPLFFIYFIGFPVYIFVKIKSSFESEIPSSHLYNAVLQLREAELDEGLSIIWLTKAHFLYSCFTRRGRFTYGIDMIVRFCMLAFFGALFNYQRTRSLAILVVLSVQLLYYVLLRPHRAVGLNFVAILLHLANVMNVLALYLKQQHVDFSPISSKNLVTTMAGINFSLFGLVLLLSIICELRMLLFHVNTQSRTAKRNPRLVFARSIEGPTLPPAERNILSSGAASNEDTHVLTSRLMLGQRPPQDGHHEVNPDGSNMLIALKKWFPVASMWPPCGATLPPATLALQHFALQNRLFLNRIALESPLIIPVQELESVISSLAKVCKPRLALTNPLHAYMSHLLDDMVEFHNAHRTSSIFALSNKTFSSRTYSQLHTLLPGFVARLSRRRFDLILIPPYKRRLLLKMYCFSVFVSELNRVSTESHA